MMSWSRYWGHLGTDVVSRIPFRTRNLLSIFLRLLSFLNIGGMAEKHLWLQILLHTSSTLELTKNSTANESLPKYNCVVIENSHNSGLKTYPGNCHWRNEDIGKDLALNWQRPKRRAEHLDGHSRSSGCRQVGRIHSPGESSPEQLLTLLLSACGTWGWSGWFLTSGPSLFTSFTSPALTILL